MLLTAVRRVPAYILSLITLATAILIGVLPAESAHAEDPTYEDAKKKADTLAAEMTTTNEERNRIRDALAASEKSQKDLTSQLKSKQGDLTTLQQRVSQAGSVAYESGPYVSLSALLGEGGVDDALDRLTYVSLIHDTNQGAVNTLQDTHRDVIDSKKAIDREITKQRENIAALEKKTKQLEKDLVHWEKLRDQLAPPPPPSRDNPTYNGEASGNAEVAVKFAYDQLGKAYKFGTSGPSTYDCSGLTKASWGQAGVSLPHSASQQYSSLPNKVSRGNITAGDLVFFYSDIHHVGIAINNSEVIHAPQAGDVVKISAISAFPYYGAARP